jgi:hypothetical protein
MDSNKHISEAFGRRKYELETSGCFLEVLIDVLDECIYFILETNSHVQMFSHKLKYFK